MKQALPFFYLIVLVISGIANSKAQTPRDKSIPISISVDGANRKVTLSWAANADATQYFVFRKIIGAKTFTNISKKLPGTSTSYTDTSFNPGIHYEYKVSNLVSISGSSYNCIGYASVGDQIQIRHSLGSILVLITDNLKDSLTSEISHLQTDLTSEGWVPKLVYVSTNDAVADVKQIVLDTYQELPDLNAVLLLGHVPVPYSGQLNPDGHGDHLGAWPADGFYGDIDGIWTDNTVSDQSSSYSLQHNVPGDGKYDQTLFPSELELAVGRVDLSDMPAFSQSEIELTRNYLNRDHDYRTKVTIPEFKALVDDNFGSYGEYFAQNAYTSFFGMMKSSLVEDVDYITTLSTNNYLWSYGCGGGSFNSAGGIGTTSDIASQNPKGIFSMLFGSYFGDWNNSNNFLRAPLASTNGPLSNCWGGRPWWVFHQMGMGATLGECGRISQNNISSYGNSSTFGYTGVHMGLMGDPTLKMYVLAGPNNVVLNQQTDGRLKITWNASTETVNGYYVYRADSAFGPYTLVDTNLIVATSYTHKLHSVGTSYYMVRAAKDESTDFGSFWNLSPGVTNSISLTQVPAGIQNIPNFISSIYPNPGIDQVTLMLDPSQWVANTTIKLSDASGRVLYNLTLSGNSSNRQTISTSEFASGIYFISVANEQGIQTLKWLKQ